MQSLGLWLIREWLAGQVGHESSRSGSGAAHAVPHLLLNGVQLLAVCFDVKNVREPHAQCPIEQPLATVDSTSNSDWKQLEVYCFLHAC